MNKLALWLGAFAISTSVFAQNTPTIYVQSYTDLPYSRTCGEHGVQEDWRKDWQNTDFAGLNNTQWEFGVICGTDSFVDVSGNHRYSSISSKVFFSGEMDRSYWTNNSTETIRIFSDQVCRDETDRSDAIAVGYCYGHRHVDDARSTVPNISGTWNASYGQTVQISQHRHNVTFVIDDGAPISAMMNYNKITWPNSAIGVVKGDTIQWYDTTGSILNGNYWEKE